jgi:hypothetical protein
LGTTGALAVGMKEASAGNDNLGWEKTSMVDVGLELGLFDFLSLEVDVYNSNTTDMLLEVPVLEYSGFSTVLQNIGKLNNKGLEITLASKNKIGRDFRWDNSFNIAFNRNEVIDLGGAPSITKNAQSVIDFYTAPGLPIGNYYTYVVDGVYKNQAEIDADVANGLIVPNAQPGDYRFVKFGSDNTIDADNDRTITGNYMPDFTYGFSTSLTYKMFDAGMSLQGVYGNEIANINRRYLANMEGNANSLAIALDRWRSEDNPGSGAVYRANRAPTGLNSSISTWHIEDGSYLRIRDITVGCTLPESISKKIKVSKLRIYFTANNPFTFTKYSGYNPEVSLETDPLLQGIDYGTYPLSKSYVVGLNISF